MLFYIFLLAMGLIGSSLESAVEPYEARSAAYEINDNDTSTQKNTPLIDIERKLLNQRDEEPEQLITMHYQDEDLISIINRIASAKNVNIVLPQGANAINKSTKVTFSLENPVSVTQAWNYLITILDIAGYALIPKESFFTIVKQSKDITRETAPIYIGISPDKLPDTDEYIKYVYYLSNLKTSDSPDSDLNTIFSKLLPQDGLSLVRFDTSSNAIILVSESNIIKSVMKIIKELDQAVYQETMEIVKLTYASAIAIANLFNESILKAVPDNRFRLDNRKPSEAAYFSKSTRIIPDPRTNHLIIVGRPQAIGRIKDFIFKYLDVDLESGQSVLHVYQLRYLNAKDVVTVLQNVVSGSRGSTGQSRSEGVQGGAERTFDEVIIMSDEKIGAEGAIQSDANYYGSNKLVIAARNDDWKVIKRLLDDLDKPHRQVLIEVLIADLTIDDTRQLQSMIRNPGFLPMPNNMAFQSAQMAPGVIPNGFGSPGNPLQTIGLIHSPLPVGTTEGPISTDLLRNITVSDSGQKSDGGTQNVANIAAAGSTVVEVNDSDGNTWGILQLLKTFGDRKVISHPHIIATHNKEASIQVTEERLLNANVSADSINVEIKIKKVQAPLKITLKPLLSGGQVVKLKVNVDITDFITNVGLTNTDEPPRLTRLVETTANVNSGDILALGGLVRTDFAQTTNETPLLGRIPLLGTLFKGRQGTLDKTSLTVFISPTIIEPRLKRGIEETTRDYLNIAEKYVQSGSLFETLKEPITRWFFKTEENPKEILDDYLSENAGKKINRQKKSRKDIRIEANKKKNLKMLASTTNNPFSRKS